ncbi:MAG: methyltransferase domain-containing protein [Crenarchaeota archaeon]|nr:methyltransferase domain-containing protein [Thermoproteota archaeon]
MSTPPDAYTYCFVSGKNWKLSLAELIAYFEARQYVFQVTDYSRTFFTIKVNKPLPVSVIDELGGILKIGEITKIFSTELILDAFIKEQKQAKNQLDEELPVEIIAQKMSNQSSSKSLFGVSVYWSAELPFNAAGIRANRFLSSKIKQELKSQGKSSRFMGFPDDRNQPQLTPVEVLKKGLVETRSEVLFCVGKKQSSIGTTISVHNPFEFQKRDVEKPIQRKIFGISPRIAKIMVNLSCCLEGKVFLDPFCGVGNILQEALLLNAKVIGLDINRWCVDASRTNLEWLSQDYSLKNPDYMIFQGDSRKLTMKIRDGIDCIATEPDLGPALRQIPTVAYATKLVDNLKPLFDDFLNQAYEVLNPEGHLVIVTPYVKTRVGKPVRLNIEPIAMQAGFTPVKLYQNENFENQPTPPLSEAYSFIDVDERHIIGREINVLKK